MREIDRPITERLSVLDRPRRREDQPVEVDRPFVQRWLQRVDASSIRLVFSVGDDRIYLARDGADGLSWLHIEPRSGSAGGTPRSTLASRGLTMSIVRRAKDPFVFGVVADDVVAVRVGTSDARLDGNVFVASGRAPSLVLLILHDGRQRGVPIPAVPKSAA